MVEEASLLQTRGHIQADRDFMLGELRKIDRLNMERRGKASDSPEAAAFERQLDALHAFVSEENEAHEPRRAPTAGVRWPHQGES
jgi:hypothetical protein